MTLDQLEDLVRYAGNDETIGQLTALIRRDWAVRVLDAWHRTQPLERVVSLADFQGIFLLDGNADKEYLRNLRFTGETIDAARLAAAQAIFPTLPEAARSELGECP